MAARRPAGLTYDTQQMLIDMVAAGLNPTTLAKQTIFSRPTIARFLDNEIQTPAVARAIARALGHEDARPYMRGITEAA